MTRNTDADTATLRAVLEAAQARDFTRAGMLANQALATGLEHPLLLNVAATVLEHAGKFNDAIVLLERAVAIAPADIGARNALALVLQRVDRPADALIHLDEILKLDPNLSFVHVSKGNALMSLGSLGRAKLCHMHALTLEPENVIAQAALASIASHFGLHEEAADWAHRALAKVPNLPDATIVLATAELAAGRATNAEKLARRLQLDPRLSTADQARAFGIIADACDASGRYTDAFNAYTLCNAALQAVHRTLASGTSVLDYARGINVALRHANPRCWQPQSQHVSPSADEPTDHVFLLGFPRSGTTLLEVVLDGHQDVVSLEEHELLIDSVVHFFNEPLRFQDLEQADEATLAPLRTAYWDHVKAADVRFAGKVFIDKHPLNTLKLPLIARLFPRAKILFAYRDPRDVVLSCYRRRFKMNKAMYELLTLPGAAALYDTVMECAERMRPLGGLAWHDVRYEDLLLDLPGATQAICGFLNLQWQPQMVDFGLRATAREHATPSTAQLSGGLKHSSQGHWRHYASALQPIERTLAHWVQRLGYPP
jgi:Flp pilus assembly protein TadD